MSERWVSSSVLLSLLQLLPLCATFPNDYFSAIFFTYITLQMEFINAKKLKPLYISINGRFLGLNFSPGMKIGHNVVTEFRIEGVMGNTFLRCCPYYNKNAANIQKLGSVSILSCSALMLSHLFSVTVTEVTLVNLAGTKTNLLSDSLELARVTASSVEEKTVTVRQLLINESGPCSTFL